MLTYAASCLMMTLEIVAHQTLPWMINCCTHDMARPGGCWPFISTRFLKDESPPVASAWHALLSLAQAKTFRVRRDREWWQWIHGLFLEFVPALYYKVSSEADWLMTRPIKTPLMSSTMAPL